MFFFLFFYFFGSHKKKKTTKPSKQITTDNWLEKARLIRIGAEKALVTGISVRFSINLPAFPSLRSNLFLNPTLFLFLVQNLVFSRLNEPLMC